MQYDRVCGFFNDIEKQGQEIAVGGAVEHSQGYFIKPTIIDNPSETSRIVLEEPFGTAPFLPKQEELVQYIGFAANRHAGPIIPIMRWSTEADVINRANNTQMGLGASVWTNDMQQGDRIARQLEAGNVWVNSHLEVSPAFPFGGHKQSGIGLELGVAGLKSFCNTQTLFLKEP